MTVTLKTPLMYHSSLNLYDCAELSLLSFAHNAVRRRTMDDARATITKLHDDVDISSALLSLHSSCSLADVDEGCTEAIAAVFTASLIS